MKDKSADEEEVRGEGPALQLARAYGSERGADEETKRLRDFEGQESKRPRACGATRPRDGTRREKVEPEA